MHAASQDIVRLLAYKLGLEGQEDTHFQVEESIYSSAEVLQPAEQSLVVLSAYVPDGQAI